MTPVLFRSLPLRCIAGLACLSLASASPAQDGDALGRAITASFAHMQTGRQPGCAVGVSQKGQRDRLAAFGYADLATAEAITPDTSFNIGSASKQFTGFAITLLERQGKLRTGDSIRRYLPELPAFAQAITIDHLLHHAGGVPNLELLIRLRGLVGNGTVPAATRIALLSAMDNWNQPPGTDYEYSNTGYFLLAQIVARVSGTSFAEFLQRHAFEPAGMRRTIVLDAFRLGAGNARAYAPDSKSGFALSQSMMPGDGPSGVQSTVRDMLAWARYVGQRERGLLARMATPSTLDSGERLAYGRGLRLDHFNGRTTVGHQGAWAGYRAEYRLFPEAGAAIMILCNRADASPWEQGDTIAAALFPGTAGATDDAAWLEGTPGRSTEAPTPGLYRNRLTGGYMTIDRDAEGLVRVEGPLRSPIVQESPGIFHTRVDGGFAFTLRYAFVPGYGGAQDRIVARSFGEPASFDRVVPWHPDDLDRYVGTFAANSLGLSLRLSVRDLRLTASVGGRDIALEPLGAEEFGNLEAGVFVRFGAGGRKDQIALTLPNLRQQTFARPAP